jgi:RimJ/RimL family protein N-acetyltransferase
MQKRIVGFHQDPERHWVAELECGHRQHVRHDPPWQVRPWVLDPETRRARLGTTLDCVRCNPDRSVPVEAVTGTGSGATLMNGDLPLKLESFATARLRAERLTEAHLPDLQSMDRDPRVMALVGGVRETARTRDYLERNLAHWARYGFGVWILREAASGTVAGRALLRHLSLAEADEIEVGYALYPAFWGRGLATEIARACVAIGRDVLRTPSIVGLALPENTGSQRVLAKADLHYQRMITHEAIPHLLFRTDPAVPCIA